MKTLARRLPLALLLSLLPLGTASLAASGSPPAQERAKLDPAVLTRTGTYHALVIGNNEYTRLPRLETAVKDAQDIANVLRSLYGFEVKLLVNATRDQIMRSISDYRRTLNDADSFLIYYAGHGELDRAADRAYWLPVDAERENNANWISADDITATMRAMPARHVLIIADSCYSGAMRSAGATLTPDDKNRFLTEVKNKRSRTLLSSGAFEPVTDGGGAVNSVFAESLIQGLSGAEDQAFSAGTLFHEFVRVRVGGRARQTPQYNAIGNSGDEGGDFVFIKALAPPVDVAANVNNALGYHNRGALYLDENRHAEAEAEYRKAVALEPANAIYRVRLSEALYGQRKYQEAELAIREAVRLDPRSADYQNRLGNTVWALSRYDEAGEAYRAGVQLDPQHFWLNHNLAQALNRSSEFAGAERYARKAVELFPKNASAQFVYAVTLKGLDRFADAETAYKASLENDPKRADVWNDYGNLLFNSGGYAASETSYRKAIELAPVTALYQSNLAVALFNLRRYPEAEAAAREAIRLDDSVAGAHFWLGRALHATSRHADAERSFRRAVLLAPAVADYHNLLGLSLAAQRRYGEAELEYKEAIRLNPKAQYYLSNLAETYAGWQRFDLAEEYYRRAIETAPADVEVRRYFGVYYYRQNRYAEARTIFEDNLQREPNVALNHYNLADTRFRLKDFAGAEAAVRRAITLRQDWADAMSLLGRILEAVDKLPEAEQAFETAGKLAPQGDGAAQAARIRGRLSPQRAAP